jgi:4-oxalomesaconate tautomerase
MWVTARNGLSTLAPTTIEHPTGAAEVLIERDAAGAITGAGTLRTARKLFDGRVFP